ncbi:MAG: hypothetical protein FJ221_18810 [Lentisphaerae bacterium]|nr:hypothetical protein [Lentisphaerota bacterium]
MLGTDEQMKSKGTKQMKRSLTLLTALLLAPLAALHAGRNLPGVPTFGKLRADSFQALEKHGTQTSNAWN